jgi:hypothetical protein
MILLTGSAGAGQKNIGIAAYASECAFPMKPAPINPTFTVRTAEASIQQARAGLPAEIG